MAQAWADVAANPEYQKLPPDQQEAARQQYFNSVVAPNAPKDQLSTVKTQFDAATAPKKPPPGPVGHDEGALSAGLSEGLDAATFGQGSKIPAALASLVPGHTYAQERLNTQTTKDAHPYAALAGDAAGLVGEGAVISKGIDVARKLPAVGKAVGAVADALTPVTRDAAGTPMRIGTTVGNIGKSVAANAAVGGGIALANGQELPQAAQTAAISGVAGPAVGKAAEFAIAKASPAAQQAWLALAKSLKEKPETLQAAIDTHLKLTGAMPSTAAVSSMASQGQLRALAASNPIVSEAALKASRASTAPLAEQIHQTQAQNTPQARAGFEDFRDKSMDAAMNTPDPRSGQTLAQQRVPMNSATMSTLTDPLVISALKKNAAKLGNTGLAGRIDDAALNNTPLTLGDVEGVRRSLRNQQSNFVSKEAGLNRDPEIAEAFGKHADKIEGIGAAVHNNYAHALEDYRDNDRYMAGFDHGRSGNAYDSPPKGDTSTKAALKTEAGKAGYEHGNALHTAEAAIETISPSHVAPAAGLSAEQLSHGAAAALAPMGTVARMYHTMRATVPGLHLPENAQKIVAKQLFSKDPATVRAGVAMLRKGRASDQQIRQLGTTIGGATGAAVASYLSKEGQ